MAERQAAKLRLEYQDAEQIRIQFQDEVNLQLFTSTCLLSINCLIEKAFFCKFNFKRSGLLK